LIQACALIVTLAGCTSDVKVKSLRLLEAGGRVQAGASVGVAVEVDDAGDTVLEFRWTSTRGKLHDSTTKAPANIYTAPGTAGIDTILVEVWSDRKLGSQSLQIQIAGAGSEPTPPAASGPAPAGEPPVVSIETPTSGSTVQKTMIAHGTARGGSPASRLWVVVNPVGEPGWWPQGGRLAPVPPAGSWDQQLSFGGVAGQRFRVAVVLASEAADRSFAAYLENGERTRSFPGKPLPGGVTILTAVDVVQGDK
jgi:hypothetical protein